MFLIKEKVSRVNHFELLTLSVTNGEMAVSTILVVDRFQ